MAKVGREMAQLGSRIIGGFAPKMAAYFFEKFSEMADGEVPAELGHQRRRIYKKGLGQSIDGRLTNLE